MKALTWAIRLTIFLFLFAFAAAFGQIDWNATDTLKATLGLRYTHDEKTLREELRLLCYGGGPAWDFSSIGFTQFCGPGAGRSLYTDGQNLNAYDVSGIATAATGVTSNVYPGVLAPAALDMSTGFYIRNSADSWNAVSGSLSLNWQPNENTLLYGRYDRGYKAGAFTNALTIVAFPEADKETVDAYEVGAKLRPLERLTTNLSVFFYDWSNRQTPVTFPAATAPYNCTSNCSIFINIPKSQSKGAELETMWTPFTDAHVRFNYSYLQATVDKGGPFVDASLPGSAPVSVIGADLPNSPRNKYSVGGDYTFRPDIGPINVSAIYSWRDKQWSEIFNTKWRETPAYGTLNLNASWTDQSGRFTIFAFGNNITNEETYQYIANQGTTFRNPAQNGIPGFASQLPGGPQISTYVPAGAGSSFQSSTYNANPLRTLGIELRAKF